MLYGIFCLGIDFEFRTNVKLTNPFSFFIWGQRPFFHSLTYSSSWWIIIAFWQELASLLQMSCLLDLNLSSSQEMKLHHFTDLGHVSNYLPKLSARKIWFCSLNTRKEKSVSLTSTPPQDKIQKYILRCWPFNLNCIAWWRKKKRKDTWMDYIFFYALKWKSAALGCRPSILPAEWFSNLCSPTTRSTCEGGSSNTGRPKART